MAEIEGLVAFDYRTVSPRRIGICVLAETDRRDVAAAQSVEIIIEIIIAIFLAIAVIVALFASLNRWTLE